MTTTADIQAQMREVERRRNEAQAAEANRLRQEAEARNQMLAAEAELETLRERHRSAQWREGVAHNGALVQANRQAIIALYHALDKAEQAFIANVANSPQQLLETFKAQQEFAEQAVGVQVAAQLEKLPNRTDKGALEMEHHNTANALFAQLENAIAPDIALAEWVSRAANAQVYRLRQGIAYAILGFIVEPELGAAYDARAVNNRLISASRNRVF